MPQAIKCSDLRASNYSGGEGGGGGGGGRGGASPDRSQCNRASHLKLHIHREMNDHSEIGQCLGGLGSCSASLDIAPNITPSFCFFGE